MAACHEELVFADLMAALRVQLADFDLRTVSGTVRVDCADGGAPPIGPPYVLISFPSRKPTYQGSPLTEYHVENACEWWAFAPSAGDTTVARGAAASRLAAQVVAAVQTAHQTPSFTTLHSLTTLLIGWDSVFADEPNIPGFIPFVHGTIEFSTDLPRGA